MQSEVIAALEKVNREIRGLVSQLSENSIKAGKVAFPPGRLEALSKRLAQTAKLIAVVSPVQPKEPILQAMIGEYLCNLVKLKGILGKVQDSLGKQQGQFRKDRERLNSARAWLEAFRQTK